MIRPVSACVAFASLLLGSAVYSAEPLGEIIGDDVYVNCEYRLAAHFPAEPMFRDLQYRDGGRTVPARQFYVDHDMRLFSVTIAHFATGPDKDLAVVERASAALRSKGKVQIEMNVWYDEPNLGGRQFNIELPDGRLMRASLYMVDNRLYITEAVSDPNDFEAFLFSESVSLIDENGIDHDSNPLALASDAPGTSAGLPARRYDCSRLNRR
jgi:hypothetical protein